MNERVAQYVNKIKTTFQQMGRKQKIWLGASIVGLVVAIVLATVIFTRTEYEVAFNNLDATDSAAVISYLDSAAIPYKLNAMGTSISVPTKDAVKAKIAIGSEGLIQNGSIGFTEAFGLGSSTLGTTENEFNVKYQNAVNGEIQKLLNGLQGIQSSKVLVTVPKESVFLTTDEQNKPTAAIVLNFTTGYRPTQAEIDGYFNLVKSSVTGLEVSDVTISSQQLGELMSSSTNDLLAGSSNLIESQFKVQKMYEQDVKTSVQQYLSQIYGVDNIVVSISSSLNFDKKSSTESLVSPLENNNNNGIIISEENNSSSSTNTSGTSGGVVGTGETDVPTYQTSTNGGESSTETNSSIKNYEVNRVDSIIESAPYVVKDLSISVGFEAAELTNQEERVAITSYLTSFVRSQLANSGQDVENDDLLNKKVTLIARNFNSAEVETSGSGISLGWLIGIGALALAAIVALVVVVARRRNAARLEEEAINDIPERPAYEEINLDNLQNDSQARKNLETLAKRKPDDFVNLLRTWLVDE
ncbi:MAG: flagellar M-ring protein FliF [Candidatus Pristimantibacillus lignocellulolyticus]|uniref:Flagellar M-ring protein n=1 Tax=Candidatus Pristimantibacillus lignocellulolyticus TaxID=2994561 RepID=A0A9J6ZB75_9BACL|nr:MAG: flagellar M-ring protein FliF [Candidatus Pristimantibacillus lignocellulolyticus]